LSFFKAYFKYYNEACELSKNKFKNLYPLIDIKDNEIQNKINNAYIFPEEKKERRSVLDKILDTK